LAEFIDRDAPLGEQLQWGGIILRLYQILGGNDEHVIHAFAAAWSILAAFLERLDHLEDGDVVVAPEGDTATQSSNLQATRALGIEYNRVITIPTPIMQR